MLIYIVKKFVAYLHAFVTILIISYTLVFCARVPESPYEIQHKRAYTVQCTKGPICYLPIMSFKDRTPHFTLLNNTNFHKWSIHIEAHLIWKDLWGTVTCETDTDGKSDAEIEGIWADWRKKQSMKKIMEAYAKMVLRVEDSQLVHMCSKDPEVIWDTLAQVHCAQGLATRLVLQRNFLTLVKGAEQSMSAWVGCVKLMSFCLEDIGVDVSNEDTILVLTMGLDKSYDSFIISLNTTPPEQLTLDYVVSCMLNEEVRRSNTEIQGVAVKARGMPGGKVRVKKEENVALATTQGDVCWCCSKPGHLKVFCTAKPLRGKEADQANIAFVAIGIDLDDEYLAQVSDEEA